jgi:hypothetical protein
MVVKAIHTRIYSTSKASCAENLKRMKVDTLTIYLKKLENGAEGIVLALEHLSLKLKALSSNPSKAKESENEK